MRQESASRPASPYRTQPEETDQVPSGIPYIVGNEAAERFSYYGMKAILAVFLTKHLVDSSGAPVGVSDDQAKATIALFNVAAYATPFLGALLADGLWGKYTTILRLSLLYCAGHAVLTLVDLPLGIEPLSIFGIGLGLIALGAGGVKPCVTAHVGDQFGPTNRHHMPKVFAWFYFAINVGSVSSILITPILLRDYGVEWAFGVPGVLMGVATFVFWLGRRRFVHIPPEGKAFLAEALSPTGLGALARITPLLLFVSIFWSLFDQTASAWVLQAEHLDRRLVDLQPLGIGRSLVLTPSQTQFINPVFVLLLIPFFTRTLYPLAERWVRVTPLRKIGMGLALAGLSFAIAALVESWITAGATPSIYWQVLMYAILTSGEVMLSITALEFCYTQAPRRMKSLVMACFMLSISLGNIVTWAVNTVIQRPDGTSLLPGASYYGFFTALMIGTVITYAAWAPTYRPKTFLQGDGNSGS